eukprot:c15014_g3_i1 orf=231-494(+)
MYIYANAKNRRQHNCQRKKKARGGWCGHFNIHRLHRPPPPQTPPLPPRNPSPALPNLPGPQKTLPPPYPHPHTSAQMHASHTLDRTC